MMKIWKSYLASLSLLCKIIWLGILPLASLALLPFIGGDNKIFLALITTELVLFTALIMDNWCFAGILKKEVGIAEVIKSAPNGRTYMKNALLLSALSPFFLAALIIAGELFLQTLLLGASLPSYLDVLCILILLFMMETFYLIANTVSRFFDGIWINAMFAYIAVVLFWLWLLMFINNSALSLLWALFLTIAAIAVHWHLMKKSVEDSYYD